MSDYMWIPLGIGFLAVLFAAYLAISVLRKDTGTPAMQKVADAIFKGAQAFLSRQYRTIAVLAVFAAILVGGVLYLLSQGSEAVRIEPGLAYCARVPDRSYLLGRFRLYRYVYRGESQ